MMLSWRKTSESH